MAWLVLRSPFLRLMRASAGRGQLRRDILLDACYPLFLMSRISAQTKVAVIGAGPIGIETAIELQKSGIDYLHFDKGQIGSTIMRYPPGTVYFSSPERICIAGVPIPNVGQTKATKEEYLAYLRAVVMAFDLKIKSYEPVERIECQDGGGFVLHTTTSHGTVPHSYQAHNVVLAVGDMEFPRSLEVPGEKLPHVSHYVQDPHVYFGQTVLIVGGKNSAAEVALRCYRAGAQVSISYRGDQFDPKTIKYWIYPELTSLIKRGAITAYFSSRPSRITPTHVTLNTIGGDVTESIDVPADFVLLLTGYRPDQSLFEKLGIQREGDQQAPVFHAETMETNVPGVYVAGTATAGEQLHYRLFIENCHIHARRIANALSRQRPPESENPWDLPEN